MDAHIELVGQPNRFTQKDASGVEHEMNRLDMIMSSSSGDCVRSCTALMSSEYDAVSKTSVVRPLEVMAFQPVHVFIPKRVGSVVQSAQTISIVHGTIDYSLLSITPGSSSDPTYVDALNTVMLHIASPPLNRRRMGTTPDNMPSIQVHADVKQDVMDFIKMKIDTFTIAQKLSNKLPKGTGRRSTMYNFLTPESGALFTAAFHNGDGTLDGIPVDADIWEATEDIPHITARFEYAQILQESRLMHLDDAWERSIGGSNKTAADAPHRILLDEFKDGTSSDLLLTLDELRQWDPFAAAVAGHENSNRRRLGLGALVKSGSKFAKKAGKTALDAAKKLGGTIKAGGKKLGGAVGKHSTALLAAGGAAAGAAALILTLSSDGGPGQDCGPALRAAGEAFGAQKDVDDAIAKEHAAMILAMGTIGDRQTHDEQALNDMAASQIAYEGTQAAIAKQTDERLSFQAAALAKSEANSALMATNTALALSAVTDTMRTSMTQLTYAINTLQDTMTDQIDVSKTQMSAIFETLAGYKSVFEEQQHAMYNIVLEPDVRNVLADKTSKIMDSLMQMRWIPIVDEVARAMVRVEPDANWADGSPRRAVVIDILPVVWSEMLTGTTPVYTATSANFKLVEARYTLACDFIPLNSAYYTGMSEDTLLKMMDSNDCVAPLTDISIAEFLSEKKAVQYNPDGLPLCKCWAYSQQRSCNIPLASETSPIIDMVDTHTAFGYAGLAGVHDPVNGMMYNPCGSATVSKWTPRVTLTNTTAWTNIFNDVCTSSKLRIGAVDVPNTFVGSFRQSGLSVTEENSARKGKLIMVGIANMKARAPCTRAQDGAPGMNPLKVANRMLKTSLPYMTTQLRFLTGAAYGFIGDDISVEKHYAYDAGSRSPYWLYEIAFAVFQGKMEPVTIYMPSPGGPIRRVEYSMPAHITGKKETSRKEVSGVNTDPALYEPASNMLPAGMIIPGRPYCWVYDCPLPCEGIHAGACDPCPTTTCNARVQGTYGYNLNPLYGLTSHNPNMRGGPFYNMIFNLTRTHTGEFVQDSDTFRFSQNMWLGENPGSFYDPMQGGNSIHEFKVALGAAFNSPLGRGDIRCLNPQTSAPGDLCSLLDNYYVLVPDLADKQAYLKGTDAEACADISNDVLCLVPRQYQYRVTLEVPVGEVRQTIGSACPSLLFADAVSRGTPFVTVKNDNAFSINFKYRWIFNGINDEIDKIANTDDMNADRIERRTNCRTQILYMSGPTIGSKGSSVLTQVSNCANWTLSLQTKDPVDGSYVECSRTNIVFLLAKTINDPAISITFAPTYSDDKSLSILASAGEATTTISQNLAIRQYALEAMQRARDPVFHDLVINMAGLASADSAALALGNLSKTFAADGEAVTTADNAAVIEGKRLADAAADVVRQQIINEKKAKDQQALDVKKAKDDIDGMNALQADLVGKIAIFAEKVDKFNLEVTNLKPPKDNCDTASWDIMEKVKCAGSKALDTLIGIVITTLLVLVLIHFFCLVIPPFRLRMFAYYYRSSPLWLKCVCPCCCTSFGICGRASATLKSQAKQLNESNPDSM